MNNDNLLIQVAEQFQINKQHLQKVMMETIMPGGKPEQVAAYLTLAKTLDLNPLNEMYVFGKGSAIKPSPTVDGWIKIMNRNPNFDGGPECNWNHNEKGELVSCTARIWRKDRKMPTEATEWLIECRQDTKNWKDMPYRMLRHAAVKQCIRYAFSLTDIPTEEAIQPESMAQNEEPPAPAPKVINPEGSQTFFLLKEQFESCQTQEALEEANSLANAYAKRGDLKKGEVDRLKLIQKQVEQEIAQAMATATEAA